MNCRGYYNEEQMTDFLNSFIGNIPERDAQLLLRLKEAADKHIWIFGVGGLGLAILRALKRNGIAVYAFCDNDSRKHGITYDGIVTRSFAELMADENAIALIAAHRWYGDIACQCADKGIQTIDGLVLSGAAIDTVAESKSFMARAVERIIKVHSVLADDMSREVYVASQVARLLRERTIMGKYKSPTQYVEQNIAMLESGEIIFDCGSWNGCSAKEFIKQIGAKCKIHCFEPDEQNFKLLKNFANENPCVTPIKAAVGRQAQWRAPFSSMEANSTFTETPNCQVDITTIDDYVKTHSVVPSFINMDIEGWELEALLGASDTIKQHKPKLAISIYHKAQDYVEIPEFVLSLRPDYKVYVRHYTDIYADTIAYFV
jgi:FkbM family methyltransferase